MGRIYDYKAKYSHYLELRKERREQQQKQYEEQQRFIAETTEFIDRFKGTYSKTNQVGSRVKMLEKLAKLERLQSEKMKQIMLLNHNDTITSSIMADSYFQETESNISNQTNDDLTLTATDNECTFNELIQEKVANL